MQEPNKAPVSPATADKIELLKRMMLCHADLQTALSAITFLNECDENEKYDRVEIRRFKCYETAFVIAYGRAFTKSNGSKHKHLSLKKIGVSLSEKEKKIHESIISDRNKKYAHSDLEKAHIRIDLHSTYMEEFELPVHHIQWDEGLDYITGFVPYEIMGMIHKIKYALTISTRTLAIELKEHLPIYITPN